MAKLKVAGLFAGIGGLELGLSQSGHRTMALCEIDPGASSVLSARFPRIPIHPDVVKLNVLPKGVNLLAAGFPCQDLSQAGLTVGIAGKRSGLVDEVFRIAEANDVPHLLLENVSFMLHLHRGEAMRYVVKRLEELGYRWAYRVIDSRAFGVPQRRERVYILASRTYDPAGTLFHEDCGEPEVSSHIGKACGFFWTEGIRGLGWAVDAVPTLKGGSTIGIPSPPAIWLPDGRIVTPDIRDAERLQGFAPGWTEPASSVGRATHRWKLVGNAVTVNAAAWVGSCLAHPDRTHSRKLVPLSPKDSWPRAACGGPGSQRHAVEVSSWPIHAPKRSLLDFLEFEPRLLSLKAVSGFLSRLESSTLRYPAEFLKALKLHRGKMSRLPVRAA